MTRVKSIVMSVLFAVIVYLTMTTGLLIFTELQSSADRGTPPVATELDSAARPVAPGRNIAQQRMSSADVESSLPPFWSR